MITLEQIKGTDEASEQIRLFAWASINRTVYPQLKWLHAIPNANSHRQVAEGVRGGVADIFLPWVSYDHNAEYAMTIKYAGLYIELKLEKRRKEKNGGLSDEQIKFGEYALEVGYAWHVCYGWLEAKQRIEEYLK